MYGVVVVPQLVERSLPTPKVCSSNTANGKLLFRKIVYCQVSRKDENKEKEDGNGPSKNLNCIFVLTLLTYRLYIFKKIIDLGLLPLIANNSPAMPYYRASLEQNCHAKFLLIAYLKQQRS